MSFNEKEFRTLVDETKKSVIALGTTSKAVLEKHELYSKKLISYLREKDSEFNFFEELINFCFKEGLIKLNNSNLGGKSQISLKLIKEL